MKDFAGKVVAITGAGSGLGRALAVEFAQRGAHLDLSDIDADGLAATAARCERAEVDTTAVDVADRAAVTAWADDVATRYERVNVIVNNAGVTVAATAERVTVEDFEWLMGINFWGVVHGTQAFLPHLKASGDGHVVNISSVFGLVSIPAQSTYNAAKFAVRGFSDALRMELEIERADVSVTTIHPGGIRTGIARNARLDPSFSQVGGDVSTFGDEFDRVARTTPERAARQIIRAVERNRRRALIGPDAKVFDLVSRLPAGVYQRMLVADGRRRLR
jgi:butyryl-CoA dehydrogenase